MTADTLRLLLEGIISIAHFIMTADTLRLLLEGIIRIYHSEGLEKQYLKTDHINTQHCLVCDSTILQQNN